MQASINHKLLGSSAIVDSKGSVIGIDMGGLIRRLIMFDEYIIVSTRLLEFRHLASHLGPERTRDLLSSGLIRIHDEAYQLAEIGRSGLFGDRVLPPLHYKFNIIDHHDRREAISKHLSELRDIPGMLQKENIRFRGQLARLITPFPQESKLSTGPRFFEDAENERILQKAIRIAFSKADIEPPKTFAAKAVNHRDDTLHIESNLTRYGYSQKLVHQICQKALMGISGLSLHIAQMEGYRAINGFNDGESPLFSAKVGSFFSEQLGSEIEESNFQRVLDVAQLPAYDETRSLDIEKLLKVRQSQEASTFREWLRNGNRNAEEIREITLNFRNILGTILSDKVGQGLRLMFTITAGVFPQIGIVTGPLASVADSVISNLFPRNGVTAFIHESYPSLFQDKDPE